MSRKTLARAVIYVIDVTAKTDGVYSSNSIQSFCDLDTLDSGEHDTIKYATCELNQFILDGSCRLMPNNISSSDVSFWSQELSDDQGVFSTPVTITKTFNLDHTVAGLTIAFDDNYALPSSIQVDFYNDINTLISSETYVPNTYLYICDKQVENFRKVVLTINSGSPYSYARVNAIEYGIVMSYETDRDLRQSALVSATVLEEIDPTNSQVAINTSQFKIYDPSETFEITNPKGFYASLQQRQRVVLYAKVNGVEMQMAEHFIKSWSTSERTLSTFDCQDLLGVLDGINFKGNLYYNVSVADIIDELMAVGGVTNYYVSDDIADITLSGVIKPMSVRKAIQQVMMACCGTADTSRVSGINFYKISTATTTVIEKERKLTSNEPKVEQGQEVTDVSITCHNYMLESDSSQAYKAELTAGTYEITFNDPYDSLSAVNATIDSSYPFGATITVLNDGEVTVDGYKYTDNSYTVTKSKNGVSDLDRVQKSITDATLISPSNVGMVADRLFAVYQYRLNHDVKIICGDEKAGNMSAMQVSNNMVSCLFTSLNIDLAGGFLAQCKGIGKALATIDAYYTGELYAGDQIGVM